ncbi:MAG: protein kinase [Sphingobacteriaceae bacterium]|nr:protein kinase [Sphingobacteriaceae bacterium]
MSTVYTSIRKAIRIESIPLSSAGGEGSVYKIIPTLDYPSHCVKIYHKNKISDLKKRKLEYLVLNKPSDAKGNSFMFCWPNELIYDDSNIFIGFIMPLAFSGSEKLYEFCHPKLPAILNSTWQKLNRNNDSKFHKRLKICFNIAVAVHSLHQGKKYVIIDLKPQNILINTQGHISIIDVDSFQVSSGLNMIFQGEVLTPDYAPIELYHAYKSSKKATENWDRFSLAVCLYQILLGIHPYTATANELFCNATTLGEKIKNGLYVHGLNKNMLSVIPPLHSKFDTLPYSLKNLFNKAFAINGCNEIARPTATEWCDALYKEIQILDSTLA